MEHPTKDQLSQMRQQGMTICEIAKALGKNQGTIEYLFRKYKLRRKRNKITLEQIEEFRRMRQEGMTITEIAEETGCPEGDGILSLKAGRQRRRFCAGASHKVCSAEEAEAGKSGIFRHPVCGCNRSLHTHIKRSPERSLKRQQAWIGLQSR